MASGYLFSSCIRKVSNSLYRLHTEPVSDKSKLQFLSVALFSENQSQEMKHGCLVHYFTSFQLDRRSSILSKSMGHLFVFQPRQCLFQDD